MLFIEGLVLRLKENEIPVKRTQSFATETQKTTTEVD